MAQHLTVAGKSGHFEACLWDLGFLLPREQTMHLYLQMLQQVKTELVTLGNSESVDVAPFGVCCKITSPSN